MPNHRQEGPSSRRGGGLDFLPAEAGLGLPQGQRREQNSETAFYPEIRRPSFLKELHHSYQAG